MTRSILCLLFQVSYVILMLGQALSISHLCLGQNHEGRGSTVLVDGKLKEPVWQSLEPYPLEPSITGSPAGFAADTRIFLTNTHIYLSAFCPEPGGKVLAYSVGYNPKWEKNASTYFFDLDRLLPPVEDRFIFRLQSPSVNKVRSQLELTVNPWGAFRMERDGKPVPRTSSLVAASIDSSGWTLEAVIPLVELGWNASAGGTLVHLEQVRSRRPLAPEYRYSSQKLAKVASGVPHLELEASLATHDSRSTDSALQVGHVKTLPPLAGNWTDSFWAQVPALELSRNEPNPRRPRYPTGVKWVHDGRSLALFFRCTEDERVSCNIGKRDGGIEADDHVAVYLATSGSSLVEILVNPAGSLQDQEGRRRNIYFDGVGEWRKIGYAYTNWDAQIEVHSVIERDAWYVRLNLPMDEIAQSLKTLELPDRWSVLLARVRQPKVGEPREISALPVVESPSFRAPARFLQMVLSGQSPAQISPPRPAHERPVGSGLASELARLDPFVLTRVQRKYRSVASMLKGSVARRVTRLAMEEHDEWDAVQSLQDWERFRDKRLDSLKASFGPFPEPRPPLELRVTGVYQGADYQVQNLVFLSRPGVYVPANLYLPKNPGKSIPAIILNPGHVMPKTQEVLKDCGMIWARAGCAVLVPEKMGHGERIETLPWIMQAYYSEELHDMQLGLVGESRLGWIAYDISRAVDLLLELGFVNPDQIVLMGGATWGAGPTAAAVGFLEERFAATVIFNFGRVYWQTGGGWRLWNCTTNKIADWFFCASKAPRKFIYAHEFWFEGEEGPDYPSVWVPAWPRYEKIYGLYGAQNNLANAQSDGLLRLDTGHCGNIDHLARREIYPVLERWFGIPPPSQEDWSIEADSHYVTDRPDYPLIKFKEAQRRMPDSELICITPEVNSELDRKALHRIAGDRGRELLALARAGRAVLNAEARREDLATGLSEVLGDIEPVADPQVEDLGTRALSAARVETLLLHTDEGIIVPLLFLDPIGAREKPGPVVIGLAEGGKGRFLESRNGEIERLLQKGIAVCLPDVRGTGETAADQYKTSSHYQYYEEIALGNTLVGLRLKDVLTVLAYLKMRADIDPARIGLWGDSFAPVNEEEIWVDELSRAPVSPQIQHHASPLGAHLALLAALYEPAVRSIVVRGGLAGYLSLLNSNFAYVPCDISVPGILQVGDIVDICAALAPRPLRMEQVVDGRNFVIGPAGLSQEMKIAVEAYRKAGFPAQLVLSSDGGEPEWVNWLVGQLE